MKRKKKSDFPKKPLELFHEHQHGHIDRRSLLDGVGRFAVGGLTVGAIFEMMRPSYTWAQQVETHPPSARVLDRLRTRFTFQISVDVATLEQGRAVAGAALAGGVNIVEMGTPLLKNQGVANVVPAFRQQFPEALLLADMKTMDGGAFEARAVYGVCESDPTPWLFATGTTGTPAASSPPPVTTGECPGGAFGKSFDVCERCGTSGLAVEKTFWGCSLSDAQQKMGTLGCTSTLRSGISCP
jgi:Orotidine 5'-phosphate decarboxylase / HUMPS family